MLYGLIRKHIAGTTINSAIQKAKELNSKKLPVSITYLSGSAENTMKARYATTTYMELIRQISRLGIKASVQVPLKQIGYDVSGAIASKNAGELMDLSQKSGVFLWFELPEDAASYARFLGNAMNVGYALNLDAGREYLRTHGGNARAIKIMCSQNGESKEDYVALMKDVKSASKRLHTVLVSAPDGLARKLTSNGRNKNLVFEFQLGHSSKEISELQKRGAKVIIGVPFGKDWADYASRKVPEKYARFIASRFLKEEAVR